jgi:hypothetical protein
MYSVKGCDKFEHAQITAKNFLLYDRYETILKKSISFNLPIKIIYLVTIRKLRMRNYWFQIRKGGLFRPGKKIEGLRGGVHRYAAQANPKIDAAWAEKNPFRTETTYIWSQQCPVRKLL